MKTVAKLKKEPFIIFSLGFYKWTPYLQYVKNIDFLSYLCLDAYFLKIRKKLSLLFLMFFRDLHYFRYLHNYFRYIIYNYFRYLHNVAFTLSINGAWHFAHDVPSPIAAIKSYCCQCINEYIFICRIK